MFFNPIDQGGVLLRSKGIHLICKLYEMDGVIYAKKGNGFLRLHKHGDTAVPAIKWSKLFPGETGTIDENAKQSHFLHWKPTSNLKVAAE